MSLVVNPKKHFSNRFCVCVLKSSRIPANTMTTLKPASTALQISPVKLDVFPDCTCPTTRPFLEKFVSNNVGSYRLSNISFVNLSN